MKLTPRQTQLLGLIQAAHQRDGVAPTLTELAEVMGCFLNAVACKVTAMQKLGLLIRVKGVHRGLRLTDAGRRYLEHGPENTTPAA